MAAGVTGLVILAGAGAPELPGCGPRGEGTPPFQNQHPNALPHCDRWHPSIAWLRSLIPSRCGQARAQGGSPPEEAAAMARGTHPPSAVPGVRGHLPPPEVFTEQVRCSGSCQRLILINPFTCAWCVFYFSEPSDYRSPTQMCDCSG